MIILKFITALGLLIALAWLYFDPKFDSAVATAMALAALIALFVAPVKKKRSSNQSQSVTDHSFGIQAGGDANIGSKEIPKVSSRDAR